MLKMNLNKDMIKETVLEMFKEGELKVGIHIENEDDKVTIEVMMIDSEGNELDNTKSEHYFHIR